MTSPPGAGVSGKSVTSVPLFEKSNAVPLSKVPAPPSVKVSFPVPAGSASTGAVATGSGSCLMLLAVVARST